MIVKLLRNFETNRDKTQEDTFENSLNISFYFTLNKKITKIDNWKLSNIKKLVQNIKEINDGEITIEYLKWNNNIQYIYDNLHQVIIYNDLKDEIKKEMKILLKSFELNNIHNYINENLHNKNLKYQFILLLLEEITENELALEIANNFINKNISSLDIAIDVLLPLYIIEKTKR